MCVCVCVCAGVNDHLSFFLVIHSGAVAGRRETEVEYSRRTEAATSIKAITVESMNDCGESRAAGETRLGTAAARATITTRPTINRHGASVADLSSLSRSSLSDESGRDMGAVHLPRFVGPLLFLRLARLSLEHVSLFIVAALVVEGAADLPQVMMTIHACQMRWKRMLASRRLARTEPRLDPVLFDRGNKKTGNTCSHSVVSLGSRARRPLHLSVLLLYLSSLWRRWSSSHDRRGR